MKELANKLAADPTLQLDLAWKLYRKEGPDWARSRLWDGDPLAVLGHAYTLLWEVMGRVREDENRRFGERLANWAARARTTTR